MQVKGDEKFYSFIVAVKKIIQIFRQFYRHRKTKQLPFNTWNFCPEAEYYVGLFPIARFAALPG